MPRPRKYNKNSKKPKITYKNQRRKQAIARMPFVEQKFKETPQTGAGVAPTYQLANGIVVNVPDVFEFMEQGDTIDKINGRWIYSKWLTAKMMVDYTQCLHEAVPMSFIMLQGWCKSNLNPGTPSTTPLAQTALQQHVANIVANAYEDPLGTGDAKNLVILKKQYLKSAPRTLVDGSANQTIFRSNKSINLKWTISRKIKYNHQVDAGPHPYMQCNENNWIPFVAWLRAPTDVHSLAAYPKIHYKYRHYFTDA